MTRYDPRVYDPEKLLDGDAARMEGFTLCGQMVLDWLDEMAEDGSAGNCIPMFDALYGQVAQDISHRIADLIDAERFELTVSLMEADPERYAAD